MKTILIETDLEGISGVSSYEQLNDTENGGYRHCCERLMADVNAAIRGAFDGGAERVLVEDGHGSGKNFISGLLDKRAEQVVISGRDFSPEGAVGLFQVGAHAMSGTQAAFLDHTQSSVSWHDYYINGRKCGEMAQTAAYTGAYGIPCVMMSGDAAACLEARRFFGDLATAEVKYAVRRNSAVCVPDAEAERRIYEAARAAMGKLDAIRPFRVLTPTEIRIEYNRADYCDYVCEARADVERLDARTVRRVVSEIRTFADVLI